MNLFGDPVQMQWGKDTEGRYHGHGYGMGQRYIFVGEFVHGQIYGDLIMYDRRSGERIMKVEMEDSKAHGRYTYYHAGDIVEQGMYRRGNKYFHTRIHDGHVYEYGFSENDELHGFGCSVVDGVKYISPHWEHGKINGLGCMQDKNGEVLFYGQFKNNLPVKETKEKHPMMLECYKRAKRYNPARELAIQCVQYVLG